MSHWFATIGYFALMLSVPILLIVLAIRIAKAQERSARALEEIARRLDPDNRQG
ncbi:hypothetical protein [Lysobacter niastensis]|uniref:Heme exporter protein D n=1 Tax=Lysobacter niastensis TaxID=380629 RepID=A0ABS0B344_9GAMM|nr:hypothetical protein [Lysobacter niastensis]MBF6022900.1 hypothetical protein [Lysobacter niastensis]